MKAEKKKLTLKERQNRAVKIERLAKILNANYTFFITSSKNKFGSLKN
jgi:hypothetical protein